MELTNCAFCNAVNSGDAPNIFTEDEINSFIKEVFSGKVNARKLPKHIYLRTAKHLTDAVFQGFGKNMIQIEYGTPDYVMLKSLRENVYVFSAAKTYQQTKKISALLTDGDRLVPFAEFKKKAGEVFTTYNKQYLQAEYNSAVAQARSASKWQTFEKEARIYPQLQYRTAGDGRVRPEHRVLDKIVRPVNDKFWDWAVPPLGWNCRCNVIQIGGVENTDLSKRRKPSLEEVPEIFRFNPGKDKIIFSPAHPYFDVAKKDKAFAKKNFNLPLP
jgi:SPP1 gp7 family putative phage head morphogenesis protein